eukprot:Skav219812  [mRNA]  locus=scaffold147:287240:299896:- [translate_table: standard]
MVRLRRFVLKNCSGNGTRLNDQLLQGRGDHAPLQHGDLVEFIQFRFDLSHSCLEGVDLPAPDICPPGDRMQRTARPSPLAASPSLAPSAPRVPCRHCPAPEASGESDEAPPVQEPGAKLAAALRQADRCSAVPQLPLWSGSLSLCQAEVDANETTSSNQSEAGDGMKSYEVI